MARVPKFYGLVDSFVQFLDLRCVLDEAALKSSVVAFYPVPGGSTE